MAAYIYLPSSYFRKSDNPIGNDDTEINILSYKKEDLLWVKDKMLQGTDKRFVVTLAKYTVSSLLDFDRLSLMRLLSSFITLFVSHASSN